MADTHSCPNCYTTVKKSFFGNWIQGYYCLKCRHRYCERCGPPCPKCGAKERCASFKVYSS